MCVFTHTHTDRHTKIHTHTHTHIDTHTHTHAHTHMGYDVLIRRAHSSSPLLNVGCAYVFMYLCIYTSTHPPIHSHTHTHTHTHTQHTHVLIRPTHQLTAVKCFMYVCVYVCMYVCMCDFSSFCISFFGTRTPGMVRSSPSCVWPCITQMPAPVMAHRNMPTCSVGANKPVLHVGTSRRVSLSVLVAGLLLPSYSPESPSSLPCLRSSNFFFQAATSHLTVSWPCAKAICTLCRNLIPG